MDNVNYNFEVLELLYKAKTENTRNPRFNKPIIITLVSMMECMLYDFLIRIRTHSSDRIPNMGYGIIAFFRSSKDSDELKVIIPQIQQQNILRALPADTIYADLEELRKIRNRIHIQNKYSILERDESGVFNSNRLKLAEKSFERVCEVLCNVYPRGGNQPLLMSDFPRPWI